MGVFDFLYKPRPKPNRVYPRRYQPTQPLAHYQQRTQLYVNQRCNSLPTENEPTTIEKSNAHLYQRKNGGSNRSYNTNTYSSYRPRNKLDTKDNYRSQARQHELEDDFTRLSRLENKIDSYIYQHEELSHKLSNIEKNLTLILNEFNEEFQDSITTSDNRHTREIGVRILNKLNNFCSIDNSIVINPTKLINEPNSKDSAQTKTESPTAKKSSKTQHEPSSLGESNKATKVRTPINYSPLSPIPSQRASLHKEPDYNYNRQHQALNSDENDAGVVKAHYAIVSSTPYSQDSGTARLTHYKSTPSLLQENQTLSYQSELSPGYAADDSYLSEQNQSRMYINMSMVMHSEHPVIEHCFRRIGILRPRIMGYKSEHKFSVFKELESEITHLMNRLDAVDCGNDNVFQQEKNIAYCELHNLAGVLERAIECVDRECIICNSFKYKQEVSV